MDQKQPEGGGDASFIEPKLEWVPPQVFRLVAGGAEAAAGADAEGLDGLS